MKPIENVSFILIARNEQFGVAKCLGSLAAMSLRNCEVICVDSGSTDETVGVMCRFRGVIDNLRVVTVKGYSNAAVARNAGMRHAHRDYIFFVDGDVEINPGFVASGLQRLQAGADVVTGRLRELQYSRDFNTVLKDIPDRFNIRNEGRIYASGGCFMATRKAVERTGLFDERLEKSQDYDYTLRLSRRFVMLAITESMGTHHTVGYDDAQRFATQLRRLHALFFGAVIRRNLLNASGILWLLACKERGIAIGGLFLASGIAATAVYGLYGAFAFGALVAVDLLLGLRRGSPALYRLYLHYLFPLLSFAGSFYIPDRRRPFTVGEVRV
ncbi:glycosyltransferase [Geobacter pelophilus]|uniref:Glycosyltransferase n=1 Tax=Geoanaerobacter pelophilus TaxID=60036 RepID=A0AAW4L5A2_9BACT|nr:glycosyltransferase [Geoanaerobacter pelophilus]MBT0666181.1 glycosyltransferase [Geoanaerobacter pelophilus]